MFVSHAELSLFILLFLSLYSSIRILGRFSMLHSLFCIVSFFSSILAQGHREKLFSGFSFFQISYILQHYIIIRRKKAVSTQLISRAHTLREFLCSMVPFRYLACWRFCFDYSLWSSWAPRWASCSWRAASLSDTRPVSVNSTARKGQ